VTSSFSGAGSGNFAGRAIGALQGRDGPCVISLVGPGFEIIAGSSTKTISEISSPSYHRCGSNRRALRPREVRWHGPGTARFRIPVHWRYIQGTTAWATGLTRQGLSSNLWGVKCGSQHMVNQIKQAFRIGTVGSGMARGWVDHMPVFPARGFGSRYQLTHQLGLRLHWVLCCIDEKRCESCFRSPV
jgi:hypothetical protein